MLTAPSRPSTGRHQRSFGGPAPPPPPPPPLLIGGCTMGGGGGTTAAAKVPSAACRSPAKRCAAVPLNTSAPVAAWTSPPSRCAAVPLNTSAPLADWRRPPRLCAAVPYETDAPADRRPVPRSAGGGWAGKPGHVRGAVGQRIGDPGNPAVPAACCPSPASAWAAAPYETDAPSRSTPVPMTGGAGLPGGPGRGPGRPVRRPYWSCSTV
jgi:translation initiation factor IF-2